MGFICPKNTAHDSTDSDYCSICGAKMTGVASSLSSGASVPTAQQLTGNNNACPDCGTQRVEKARFCEVCRYDFQSNLSRTPQPTVEKGVVITPQPVQSPSFFLENSSDVEPAVSKKEVSTIQSKWHVLIVVDPTLYVDPDPETPCPTNEPERMFPLDLAENLLGRRSNRKDIKLEIPINDPGLSHRHAKLLRQADGSFALLDLGSTNGTMLNNKEVSAGVLTPLNNGDEIVVGCWTRVTIRRAG